MQRISLWHVWHGDVWHGDVAADTEIIPPEPRFWLASSRPEGSLEAQQRPRAQPSTTVRFACVRFSCRQCSLRCSPGALFSFPGGPRREGSFISPVISTEGEGGVRRDHRGGGRPSHTRERWGLRSSASSDILDRRRARPLATVKDALRVGPSESRRTYDTYLLSGSRQGWQVRGWTAQGAQSA